MTYDPHAALVAIDDNVVPVVGFFSIVAVATFVYLVTSFRVAVRDRAYGCALPAVGWFAIHDLGFVLQYADWFHTYDHWWVKAWWFALIATSIVEFALVGLVVRYGHAELAPHLSRRTFALGVMGAVIGITALWILVKRSVDDELYLISFPITAFWAVPFGTALLLRRRTQRGQSVVQPGCVAIIVAGFQGALWYVDDFFRTWEFVGFTIVAVAWSLGNMWLVRTLPAWRPGEDRSAYDW